MSLEEYAYLAQILGVVVVVVTLVYLAAQVKQGADLLRSESRQALMSNDRDVLLAYLDNIDLIEKLTSDQPLTHAEQWRFSVLWIVNMRNREYEWRQYKEGLLDESTWHSYREILRFTLGSQRRRLWWATFRNGFNPEFVAMVEDFIGAAPEIDIMDRFFGAWDRTASP